MTEEKITEWGVRRADGKVIYFEGEKAQDRELAITNVIKKFGEKLVRRETTPWVEA